ncbi:MAG: hypothetical protein GWM98_13425, partial [Nitrospinaceae bacterium]|nr:hypothetical protein [Nitrospinaceae bacterium]NIR55289.1 hypothetical protein [Nitrospinaceae bacterium]NIS85728.1 hypothetical protein [Nitrospinaceae bacterium]NIT82578.1 hypothetical protein [Nitrospinaceae bacterium]NIU44783.1 hypothetical protein [Nitrospinaceae bacterium]
LWTLDHLEYQSVVSPTLNDDNAGLTQPVVTVTLWNGAEEPLGRVTVGTEAGPGSEHYARVAGDPALYTIK